jgi:hypothetical protein
MRTGAAVNLMMMRCAGQACVLTSMVATAAAHATALPPAGTAAAWQHTSASDSGKQYNDADRLDLSTAMITAADSSKHCQLRKQAVASTCQLHTHDRKSDATHRCVRGNSSKGTGS